MADFVRASASLVPHGGGTPAATPTGGAGGFLDCTCPGLTADGSVKLRGAVGESLTGWALGYIQLKFIATDYARYRGNTVAQGSVKVSRSNQILCRDTDEASPELWYDPISWGIHGARGTKVLGAGIVIPASGEFLLTAGFGDGPHRSFDNSARNTTTGVDNFLHMVDIALHFCTMLTVRDPGGTYTVLKHFYWNVRWAAHLKRDAAGIPQVKVPADHLDLNIQHKVHSDVPNDSRFKGREFDGTLPISNTVSRRPKRVSLARDWAEG